MYHVRSMYDDHEYAFKRCHRYELSLNSAIAVSGCSSKQTKATLEYVVAIPLACHLLVCDWGVVYGIPLAHNRQINDFSISTEIPNCKISFHD
jgi:hypothetical protein